MAQYAMPVSTQVTGGRISTVLRIDQVPKIKAHVIKRAEDPGGIGESGAGPQALRNPVYAAMAWR